jgi:hypothetical protein
MAVKFTPGPWQVQDKFLNVFTCTEGLTGFTIHLAKVNEDQVNGRRSEALANARLIAAAPELLEALQHAHDYLAASGWESDPRMHKIIAALDRAEGRT